MNPFRSTACFVLIVISAAAQSTGTAPPDPAITALSPLTVTATREHAPLSQTPVSVDTVLPGTIRETAPLHPGQLLGQVPGVAVAVTNGEGHTTAIRQPFTTSPVYLFLEDGVPIRATGFFNHNALYEVDLPTAGGVEVMRGPATALYGSDAIGGVINVLTRAPVASAHLGLTGEAGAFGTWRALASGGASAGAHAAYEANFNRTHADGWRDRTAYDRTSLHVRLDADLGADATLKTTFAFSHIDQQTGANSPLSLADYRDHPTRNLLGIAYREVSAVRLASTYERPFGPSQLSLVPYFRDNAMELNGSYNLNSDPRIERTHNVSYGLLAKWRTNFMPLHARIIAGADLDYSPGSRQEDNLFVTRSGTGANTVFTGYAVGTRIYDYRVIYRSASPYLHAEVSPTDRLRLTGGLRYDALAFSLRNHLAPGLVTATVLGNSRSYAQLGDDGRQFTRTSPKLGATYQLGAHAHLYGSYHFGFRVPSESQLYRAGNDATSAGAVAKARLARELQPIRARQVEIGLRGDVASWSYNVVAYDLVKRDDLVSQRDPATNVSVSVNAGQTEHRGVEVGVGGPLVHGLRLDTALSYSRQKYVDWVTATTSYNGHDIEAAPHVLANTRLTWRPVTAVLAQLEWVRIGAYWLEPGNSPAFGRYPGHDLLNLRTRYAVTRNLNIFARLMNLADRRFADSASVTSNTAVFSPGLPRAAYGGVELTW